MAGAVGRMELPSAEMGGGRGRGRFGEDQELSHGHVSVRHCDMNTAGGRGSGWVWKSAHLCRRTAFKFMSMSEVPGERRGRTPSKPGAELIRTRAEAEILSSWQETAPAPASRSAPCCSSHRISLPGLLYLPGIRQGGLRGMGGAEYPDASEPSRMLALPDSAGHLQDPVPTKAGIGCQVPVKCIDPLLWLQELLFEDMIALKF